MHTCLVTIFDYNKNPPRALRSVIRRGDETIVIVLYEPKTGLKMHQIYQNVSRLSSLSGDVLLNDTKSHLYLCDMPKATVHESYVQDTGKGSINHRLARMVREIDKLKPESWRNLVSNAAKVYRNLELRPIFVNGKHVLPKYDLNTFTGRSKTLGFNIQGANDSQDISLIDHNCDTFVQFDWVAADFRLASIISNDKLMQKIFVSSDPYEKIAKIVKTGTDRDELKIEMLSNLYRMQYDYPIFALFPRFQSWMRDTIDSVKATGISRSIFGRRFSGRSELSVFNAIIQGSVTHAMHLILPKVFEQFSDYLVTEVHDSIILSCPKSELRHVVADMAKIMSHPFLGILDQNPVMPIKISVGNRWKKWKKIGVYRG